MFLNVRIWTDKLPNRNGFLNKASKVIKQRKPEMVTEDRPSNLKFWKQRQEQYRGHWLMESCLNSRVNYSTSALYPGEEPDLEILSSSFMKLLKMTLGQPQTKKRTEFRKYSAPLAKLAETSWRQVTCKHACFSPAGHLCLLTFTLTQGHLRKARKSCFTHTEV